MPHSEDESFFDKKRPWSRRKNLILKEYLPPYFAKMIGAIGKPILVVDGFAGRGKFKKGDEPGSPLVIAECIQGAMAKHPSHSISLLAIEEKEKNYEPLKDYLAPYPFARTEQGRFLDFLAEIEQSAKTKTVFLYVDPYATEGFDWESLDSIFKHLRQSGSSIEILINLNVFAFTRCARAALAKETGSSVHVDRLNSVAGGDWWQNAVAKKLEFDAEVAEITAGFCSRFNSRFTEVCYHPIKEKPSDKVPKYVLLFASRSTVALRLMNDAAVKSLGMFADQNQPKEATLFETRGTDIVPDPADLSQYIRSAIRVLQRATRFDLATQVIRTIFGVYAASDINRDISDLINRGILTSSTGKSRINDKVEVWLSNA